LSNCLPSSAAESSPHSEFNAWCSEKKKPRSRTIAPTSASELPSIDPLPVGYPSKQFIFATEVLTSLGGQSQTAKFIFATEVPTSLRGQHLTAQPIFVTEVLTSLGDQIFVRSEMKISSRDSNSRHVTFLPSGSQVSEGGCLFHNTNQARSKQFIHFHYEIHAITFHYVITYDKWNT